MEFCPDNTCHRFKATKAASRDDLADFMWLYLRYYSDYLTLSEWRRQETTSRLIDRLMTKPQFAACRTGSLPSLRSCAIRSMIAKHGIVGYGIRYDEGRISIHRLQLTHPRALAE
jgi:hypothetical protein